MRKIQAEKEARRIWKRVPRSTNFEALGFGGFGGALGVPWGSFGGPLGRLGAGGGKTSKCSNLFGWFWSPLVPSGALWGTFGSLFDIF